MRVEINFGGDAAGGKEASRQIVDALKKVFTAADAAGAELKDVKITSGQASETEVNARRMQNSLSGVTREARETHRELEKVRLATYGSGGLFGGILPGGARGRTGAYGALGILAAAGLGPVGGAAAGGLAALPGLAAAGAGAIGVLTASFHGLGKALEGDKAAFDKLNPSTQDFVQTLRSLSPWLHEIQDTARKGLFPGIDQGLHSALTPANAQAIQTATAGIATSLAQVAAEWGKSIGSPEFTAGFGQVMAQGAVSVHDLGDAGLHLAGALGKITVAAGPLLDWETKGIDLGAKLLDNWIAQKQASGELAHGMDVMKGELQIVGQFLAAVADAGFQVGHALAPLGNEIIVGLTHELQKLAEWVETNREEITKLSLGALHDVEHAAHIAENAFHLLGDALGGSKEAAELLLAVLVGGKLLGGLTGLTAAAGETGAAGATGLLLTRLSNLAKIAAAGIVIDVAVNFIKGNRYDSNDTWTLGGIAHALNPANWGKDISAALGGHASSSSIISGDSSKSYLVGGIGGAVGAAIQGTQSSTLSKAQLASLWVQGGGDPKLADTMAAIALAESSGRVGALNDDASTGDYSVGPWQINYFGAMRAGRTKAFGSSDRLRVDPLANARAAVSIYGSQGLGAWSTYTSGAYKAYLGGASSPWRTPDPMNAGTAPSVPTEFLSLKQRVAIAVAGTTPGTADDLKAVRSAVNYLKATLGEHKGEEFINAAQELTSLQSALSGLSPKAKRKTIGDGGVVSAADWNRLLLQVPGIVQGASGQLAQMVAAQKQQFQQVFHAVGQAATQALQDEAAKWKSPAQVLIDQLTSAHDDQALQTQLEQAQQQLADALVGKPDDSAIVNNVRAILGRQNLANMVDQVQSAILGGVHQQLDGDTLLKQLTDAVNGATATPDDTAVKQATKGVEDAKYAIRIAGLQKTAAAETTAHDDELAANLRLIENLDAAWGVYYAKLAGRITGIPSVWAAMGVDVNALEQANPSDEGIAAALGRPTIDGAQWTLASEQAAQAIELAQVNALRGGYGPKGGVQLHAAGGIAVGPVYRNVIGEAGPEAMIPLNDPRARQMLGGGDVIVELHGDLAALEPAITTVIRKNGRVISDVLGRQTSDRLRGGRF